MGSNKLVPIDFKIKKCKWVPLRTHVFQFLEVEYDTTHRRWVKQLPKNHRPTHGKRTLPSFAVNVGKLLHGNWNQNKDK